MKEIKEFIELVLSGLIPLVVFILGIYIIKLREGRR